MHPMTPKALIFDVFGTLVDWRRSVARHMAPYLSGTDIDPTDFAVAWRNQYQPAMARIREGNRGYVALDDLHLENLDVVLDQVNLADAYDPKAKADMNRAWECLDPWPDVVAGLTTLKQNAIIAPNSNGSMALMTRLAKYGGLPWDVILGADIAQDYKPKSATYLGCCTALRLDPDQVMMVAAHNDDLHAAQALGLQTAFILRPTEHGPHQTTDLQPSGNWTATADTLPSLASQLF